MQTVTTGLRNKIENATEEKTLLNCTNCGGTGTIVHGHIEIKSLGDSELFDDCGNCSGSGIISQPFKRIRKKKSKVEAF